MKTDEQVEKQQEEYEKALDYFLGYFRAGHRFTRNEVVSAFQSGHASGK